MGQGSNKSTGDGVAWGVMIVVAIAALSRYSGSDTEFEASPNVSAEFVTASALNCRAEDSATATVVESLPHRQSVNVLERRGEWSRVDAATPCWVSTAFLSETEPLPLPPPLPPPVETFVSSSRPSRSVSRWSCARAPYCTGISSCAEAQFYFQECGVGRLDGDNDGVPCESLC